ncbi:hypothetical protein D0962_36030 [Leptolyngbyaceae cyanobacterium CCMR0082]|uniref:Uncharacterized protein n=2 Tax=Adonisia turfae TaxID=2950184 RepID=A0A6M0SHM5_9CYAN|nr:hypothetical protein [Adonisia turfae]MDV3353082.1 hypothetical protein [Leptothoe sp. LEGE 181152]NEZ54859.1 hypothetical protein [Adonisia turfae CCMR0081]NEZ68080.1 hypothetical protein [Adonisia turfae CCMR0082]
MQIDSLSDLIQKGFLLLLNFVDDIAIFTLTRLGWQWVWLEWLSTALLIITLVYWSIRLWKYCKHLQRQHCVPRVEIV